jgi:hypothetical protein
MLHEIVLSRDHTIREIYIGPRLRLFFLVGWDLRHQVLRPLLAYCTAPNDRRG